MFQATFTRRFSAAHRVAGDPGACQRIHGHNYEAEITVTADKAGPSGFVVPADSVKAHVDGVFDHMLILAEDDPLVLGVKRGTAHPANGPLLHNLEGWITRVPFTPSTENLAQYIADQIAGVTGVENPEASEIVVRVFLRETPTIAAKAEVHYRPRPPEDRYLGRRTP